MTEVRRLWSLTWTLALTDWKLKFYGSVLGVLWTLVRPFALFGVIFIVFTEFANLDANVHHYGVYILFAMVLFNYFAEVTTGCVTSLVTRENLLRKMHFNPIVIPLSIAVTALLNLAITFAAVLIFAFSNGVWPMWTWIELPVIVLVITMLAVGMGMLLSALYVRYRDMQPIWEVFSQMLFYGSSVLYVATYVKPPEVRPWFLCNPISAAFAQMRHAVDRQRRADGHVPHGRARRHSDRDDDRDLHPRPVVLPARVAARGGEPLKPAELRERRRVGVTLGVHPRIARHRPLDRQRRVHERDPALDVGRVVRGLLVEHVGDLAGDREAVPEARRRVEHAHVVLGELEGLVLPKRRRVLAHVDEHVDDRPATTAHELRAARADVEVHAADRPVARARVVVLDHRLRNSQLGEVVGTVGLREEAAFVAVHRRDDQERALQARRQGLEAGHRAAAFHRSVRDSLTAMSTLSPVQRSRAVLGAGVRAVQRAYRQTAADGPVASPRWAPFVEALEERAGSAWADPLGPVTSDLYARLTDEDIAALEERLEPDLRGYWDPAEPELRRRLALLFSLWYQLPGAIERTGLRAEMPPDGTHAMARGPLAAGGDLYTADLVATLLSRSGFALDEGMTVLDFGASSGRVLRVFNAWRPDLDGIGCDPNAEAIGWASEHLAGMRWFVSPTSPPLALDDVSVDIAYAISVWSHFAAPEALVWLEEMHRIVKPGGALLLTTHGYDALAEFTRRQQMHPDPAGRVTRSFAKQGHAFIDVFGPDGDWGVKAEGWGNSYMTIDWLAQHVTPQWAIRIVELGALDRVQDVIVLERV